MKKLAGVFDSFNKMCIKDESVTLWSLKYDYVWKGMDLKQQFIFKLQTSLFRRLLVLLLEMSHTLAKTLDSAIPWITQWLWA